jgi:hypothetical protein
MPPWLRIYHGTGSAATRIRGCVFACRVSHRTPGVRINSVTAPVDVRCRPMGVPRRRRATDAWPAPAGASRKYDASTCDGRAAWRQSQSASFSAMATGCGGRAPGVLSGGTLPRIARCVDQLPLHGVSASTEFGPTHFAREGTRQFVQYLLFAPPIPVRTASEAFGRQPPARNGGRPWAVRHLLRQRRPRRVREAVRRPVRAEGLTLLVVVAGTTCCGRGRTHSDQPPAGRVGGKALPHRRPTRLR